MRSRLRFAFFIVSFVLVLVGLSLLWATRSEPPLPPVEPISIAEPTSTPEPARPASWQPINDGLPGYAFVTAIIVLPSGQGGQPAIIVGAYEPVGVYRSDDGGASWRASDAGLDGAAVFTLVRDPVDTHIIYAGTVDGIYRSTDGGLSWQRHGNTQGPIYTLLFDDRQPGVVYAGTIGAVLRSTDGGNSWTRHDGMLTGSSVLSLAFGGEARGLYAGTNGAGIVGSSDGVEWTRVYPTTTVVSCIVADPFDRQHLLARAQDKLMRSTDGGLTWEATVPALQGQLLGLVFAPREQDVVYALTANQGVHVSRDGGMTWQAVGRGLERHAVYALNIPDRGSYRLLAGTVHGVWGMLADGTWSKLGEPLGAPVVRSLAISPNGELVAGTTDGLFHRQKEGWQRGGNQLTGVHVLAVAYHPRDDRRIMVGTWFHGIQVTHDGGTTWTQTTSQQLANIIIPRMVIDRQDPNNVYARVEYARLLVSRDGGGTWREASLPITVTVFSIAVTPGDGSRVYVGTDRGMYWSQDHGDHWHLLSALPAADSIHALIVHPEDANLILVGSEGGVHRSLDSGRSWQAATGIEDTTVTVFAVHPDRRNVIYAGTRYNGVFVSTDGGAHWTPLARGLEHGRVNDLVVDQTTGTLYAATESGVYALTGSWIAERGESPVRPAEEPTPAVPAPRREDTVSLAMHTLRADGKLLSLVHEAGFDAAVQVIAWRDIEPEKGTYVWEFPDNVLRAAEFYGLSIVLRVDFQPLWARNTWINAPPERLDDYGDFVHALANRYRGRVKGYIIWNEPNLAVEWGGEKPNPDGYAELLKVAYRRIKDADPQALVVSAGLAPTNEQSEVAMDDRVFLQALYAAGAKEFFDVLGAHPYGFGYPPDDPYGAHDGLNFARLQDLRKIMETNDDAAKPVWITEFGWPTEATDPYHGWQVVTEEEQATYLVRACEKVLAEWPWVRLITVWNLSVKETAGSHMRGYSILHGDYTPKPAYDALRRMAQQHRPAQAQPEPSRVQDRVEILAADVVVHLGDQDYLVWPWVHVFPRTVPATEWQAEFFVRDPGDREWTLMLDCFQLNEWGNRIAINGRPLVPRFLPGRINDWAGYWTRIRFRVTPGVLRSGSNWLTIRTSMNAPVHQVHGVSWEDLQIRNVFLIQR